MRLTLLFILGVILLVDFGTAAPIVTNLQAQYRCGQVFLTWNEPPVWQGSFTVRSSAHSITTTNIGQSKIIAEHINPGSAYDWWLNPETFGNPLPKDPTTGQKPPILHKGFLIRPDGTRLNPDSGLFVHTVMQEDVGLRYYAVTPVDTNGNENLEVVAGSNSLVQPVAQKCEPVEPIWQETNALPDSASARNLPLHLTLHAKTGRGGMQYLAFGDTSLGWRESLPFKFGVQVTRDAVIVTPTDRTWIGRMFPEGRDGCQKLTPAIHSFWYGYNSRIYDPERMNDGVPTNYTERRLLWIIAWVKRTFQTDPNRTYIFGSSLGGCGSISFALRHPEIFAGIRAHVPIVAYDKGPGGDSEFRIIAECGPLDRVCSEGIPLKQRLDSTRFVRETKGDLPYLIITNGRQDGSIPWWKCPDFYRALRDSRHGFIAAWDNESHGTCMKDAPADIRKWNNLSSFNHITLNRSYLVFSNSSADQNPGNGSKTDGDLVGYMNRGLAWDEPLDDANRYEVIIKWSLASAALPVTVNITPRRLQAFQIKPGQKIIAMNLQVDNGKELQCKNLTVDECGLVTFDLFQLTSPAGNKLVLQIAR